MKTLVLVCVLAVATARPQDERTAEITEQKYQLSPGQNYDMFFETSNGISRDESGLSYPGEEPEEGKFVQSGSWSFTHPNGQVSEITFTADENGYRPEGDIIPVSTGEVNIQDA